MEMSRILFLACAVATAIAVVSGRAADVDVKPNHWAVLVAGSNGYYNYRHQADVCHAYHVLRKHGVPEEQIIVMMYDDIANNPENPIKGKLFNHINGSDVYAGVKKDYTGKDVTPENFLKILLGKEMNVGTGKTLKSGADDYVFVNFVDHGGPGLLGFPDSLLNVKDWIDTINKMSEMKKYKQMVMYIEACESGSMFEGKLKDNINIFVTTAANAHESSYACYYDEKVHTYLGDVYSVNWMEDSDKENLSVETLEKQFRLVKSETKESHVMQYGQIPISKDIVGDFQGVENVQPKQSSSKAPRDSVPSREVPVMMLKKKIQTAKDVKVRQEAENELKTLMSKRQYVDALIQVLADKATTTMDASLRMMTAQYDIIDLDCHAAATTYFNDKCFNFARNSYVTKYAAVLVNMCEEGIPVSKITSTMDEVCKNIPETMNNVV